MITKLTAVNEYGHIVAERNVSIIIERHPIALSSDFDNTIANFCNKLELTGSKIDAVYFDLPSRMNEEKFLR